MDPIAIAVLDTGKIVGYVCSKCKMMATNAMFGDGPEALENALARTTECCVPKICQKHQKEVRRHCAYCDQCESEKRWEREQERFDKAKKIPYSEYTGEFLYRDGFGNEGYFSADEHGEMEDDEGPITWAWGCTEETVTERDCDLSDHVYECILSDHHESAGDYVDDAKIAEASKLLFEACKDVKSYMEDNSVVVTFEGWES